MAAVFLLVVVAAFIAYAANQASVQQQTTIADVQSARAYQAARAGLEWGAYQVLRTSLNPACPAGTIGFAGTTLADFVANVSCTSSDATEGALTITTYNITSTACNAASCPSGTPNAVYAERQVSLTLTKCTANC
jgi:MSHA biogenesis protein MshP